MVVNLQVRCADVLLCGWGSWCGAVLLRFSALLCCCIALVQCDLLFELLVWCHCAVARLGFGVVVLLQCSVVVMLPMIDTFAGVFLRWC